MYTHVCIYVRIHLCVYMYVYTCVCVYMYVYTCVYTCIIHLCVCTSSVILLLPVILDLHVCFNIQCFIITVAYLSKSNTFSREIWLCICSTISVACGAIRLVDTGLSTRASW